jgi:hypothetical protein
MLEPQTSRSAVLDAVAYHSRDLARALWCIADVVGGI